jgi:site-specific DNA-cytosine methylase
VLAEQSHTLHRAKGPSEAQIVARFGDDGQAFDADGVRDASGVPEGMDDPAGMDAPRYKALGNAVTVNTVRWILGRIAAVEKV